MDFCPTDVKLNVLQTRGENTMDKFDTELIDENVGTLVLSVMLVDVEVDVSSSTKAASAYPF